MGEINYVQGVDPHLTELPIFAGSPLLAELGQVLAEVARQYEAVGIHDYQGVLHSRQLAGLCVLTEQKLSAYQEELQQLRGEVEALRSTVNGLAHEGGLTANSVALLRKRAEDNEAQLGDHESRMLKHEEDAKPKPADPGKPKP